MFSWQNVEGIGILQIKGCCNSERQKSLILLKFALYIRAFIWVKMG